MDPNCTDCNAALPKKFAHLHQHTQYSLLDGAAKVKDLLKWVKEVTPHSPACAMTDHGNMHGAVSFYNYALELEVKPILGYEAYLTNGSRFDRKRGEDNEKSIFHLTLLAKNFKGYQNLCRLSSIAYLEGYYYKPRIDHAVLEEYSEGIIAFTGCLGAEVPQLIMKNRLEDGRRKLEWYLRVFGADYFVEIQNHGIPEQQRVNEVLREWAREYGIGMAATNDGHYVKKDDARAHETLLAIQTKATLDDPNRFKFPCDEFYVKSLEEMQLALPLEVWGSETFSNTAHIAEICNVELPVGKKRVYQMPQLPIPQGRTMSEELRVQTYRGLETRYRKEGITLEFLRFYAAKSWEYAMDASKLERHYRSLFEVKISDNPEKFTSEQFALTGFAGQVETLRSRLPDFDAEQADLEQLYTALAFMGTLWEDLGKAGGEKYTQYPALEELEKDDITTTPAPLVLDKAAPIGRLGESGTSRASPPVRPLCLPAQYQHALVLIRRAEYECSVINNMGFPDYFLIVADYINWAKAQKISVGPGRGSGAGSIVAYCMNITNLDPLEFELLFERFLNPDRVSMPDFDIDFSDSRREEVIQYVRLKYGDDKVAQIATFGTMSSRAVLRDVARVMSLPYADADKVSKMVPVKFGKPYTLEQARDAVPDIGEFLAGNEGMNTAYTNSLKLEGLTRHASVHAAGVVIGREPLRNLVPLMRDPGGGMNICQYDMKAVEDIGLIKMDFLGLRTLSFLEEAVRILRESKGLELNVDAIPFDDEKTFDLLSRGDNKGVFQLEGTGIADASRRLKPRRLADIIALSALYRPGPMENIPTYIRRHHGLETVDYVRDGFPNAAKWLEKILAETYGIPVYQEQIMQIASEVAGYSLGGADLLRRAMGKKDTVEMQKQRQLFIAGSKINNVPKEEANNLFDLLEAFANYGFNKSHSAAYGVISYQTAYLKANYPVEFMAALLTVERRDSDKVSEYASDARKMGVEVLPPDINRSSADFRVDGVRIYFGLFAIKGLGENAVVKILEERSQHGFFLSLADFCSRVDKKLANTRAIESLIKAGAFDEFGERHQLLEGVEEAMNYAAGRSSMGGSGMDALFGMAEVAPEPKLKTNVAPYSALEQLKLEKDTLGLYISGHPLEQYEGLREAASCKISELEDWFEAQPKGTGRVKVVLAGMIESVAKKPTKSGGMMAKFNLADESGSLELVAFSRAYERVQEKLIPDSPALVIVELDNSEGSLRAIAEEVVTIENLQDVPQIVCLSLDLNGATPGSLLELRSMIDEFGNEAPLVPLVIKLSDGESFEDSLSSLKISQTKGARDTINTTFPWAEAFLAYDTSSVLSKFAPKPRWTPREGAGKALQA